MSTEPGDILETRMSEARYISFPDKLSRLSLRQRLVRHLASVVLLPSALGSAALRGTPGMRARMGCIGLGMRALLHGDLAKARQLIVDPMDSFRYFEFDFVETAIVGIAPKRYLDVSSPRLVPIFMLGRFDRLVADIINPIGNDLAETRALLVSLALTDRCRLNQELIETADYADRSFDLITSISVVEHIPDDTGAIATMWRLLRPGGRLVITVPCAQRAADEFASLDEYRLFDRQQDGFVFWQRYYDEAALAKRIWSVTGPPSRVRIYGETEVGNYDENVRRKRSDPGYPFWREPVMMAKEYREFRCIGDLVGMGVIGMEFTKPNDGR